MWRSKGYEHDVAGIIMAHKGETRAWGPRSPRRYQALFVGKKIFDGDEFVSVTLRKGGAKDPAHEVDAMTGRYEDFGRRDGDALQQPATTTCRCSKPSARPQSAHCPVRRSLTKKM